MSSNINVFLIVGALTSAVFGCSNSPSESNSQAAVTPGSHDLAPFFTTWLGGGTMTIDGSVKKLEVVANIEGV